MMRADPFTYYSAVVRTLVYVVTPAFAVLQYFRARRALHVFQLEGYKRARFLAWTRANPDRRMWLTSTEQKKPLVMTGRAWRILIVTVALTVAGLLVPAGIAHLAAGSPLDLIVFAVMAAVLFIWMPYVMVAADRALGPVQGAINAGFARRARARLAEVRPTVVGVTGSFGKTSTKFAIAAALGGEGVALATPGSFNTPLGVSRTINEQLTPTHRYFVVEMGAYGVGEIAELCRFVEPSIGVLTAVGPAHLERYGSMDAIRRAKYEIVQALPPDGTAVMNSDDPIVRELADGTRDVRVVRYGIDPDGSPDVTARDIETTARGTRLTVVADGEQTSLTTRLLGKHAIGQILAAVAVARATGRSMAEIGPLLARMQPVEHRLQLIEGSGGVTVIDDAYNSNPDGAAAALEVLDAMPGERKVVVTPGMIELGELQDEKNEEFGRHAGRVADHVVVVARVNRDAIVRGAREGGRAEVHVVDSLAQATEALRGLLRSGDVVLFENDLPDQYEG